MSISDYREAVRKGAHCKIGLTLGSVDTGAPAITILPVGGVSGAVFSFEEILIDWKALCIEREELNEALLTANNRLTKALAENMCPACGGTGEPVSGKKCMCGGTGKASGAVEYLLEELARLRVSASRPQVHPQTYADPWPSEAPRFVEVFERQLIGITWENVSIGRGLFRKWGCDYEEFDTGPGNYSTAIVEMGDGSVKNVPVELIRFVKEEISQ